MSAKRYTVLLQYENSDTPGDRYIAHTVADGVCGAVGLARNQMAAANEVDVTVYADAPAIAVFEGWINDVYDGRCD